MSFDNQRPRLRFADETRVGKAYERAEESSEFGFIPEYVNHLPYSEVGPYRGKAPRSRPIIGRFDFGSLLIRYDPAESQAVPDGVVFPTLFPRQH
jgi:hypothetical protein